MNKGELIGKGMTAEVYRWGKDKVLKLYFEKFSEDWVNYEAKIGRAVHEAGVPSPAVYDTLDMDGRKGVIFQWVSGKSVLKTIEEEPWKMYYLVLQTAGLHYQIHKCTSDRLPSQQQRFEYTLGRSSELLGNRKKRIMNYLAHLPNGESICHGDLHFNNIIASNRKLTAIDWNGAYKGNPLGDVARTCLIMTSPAVPPGTSSAVAAISPYIKMSIFWTYMNEYMRLSKIKAEDVDPWMLPVAAAKLKDKIPGEEKWLMNIIDKRLAMLKV